MRAVVLSSIAVFALECTAAETDWAQGWYAGGGISVSNVFAVEGSGYLETSGRGSNDTGFVINSGYRWSRNVAFEIGYLDGGTPKFSRS